MNRENDYVITTEGVLALRLTNQMCWFVFTELCATADENANGELSFELNTKLKMRIMSHMPPSKNKSDTKRRVFNDSLRRLVDIGLIHSGKARNVAGEYFINTKYGYGYNHNLGDEKWQ